MSINEAIVAQEWLANTIESPLQIPDCKFKFNSPHVLSLKSNIFNCDI